MSVHASSDSFNEAGAVPPVSMRRTRPLYWSIRREIWENRSIYIAPLVVAAVVLFGSMISSLTMPHRLREAATAGPAKQRSVLTGAYHMAPAPIMLASFIVGLFYSLDALYGERRDRSLLFWKSLPVSDRTTVLSKAAVPLVVLPLLAVALGLFAQIAILISGALVLAGNGMNPGRLWQELPLFQEPIVMLYGMSVHALWFAPIYAWLLFISAWAKRAPFLWLVFPLFTIGLAERGMFGTTYFVRFIKYRLGGAMIEAFGGNFKGVSQWSDLSPLRYLTSAGLWLGLGFTAACLAGAIRLRRRREPI
jgi:ABC-2 type transport system permease protein